MSLSTRVFDTRVFDGRKMSDLKAAGEILLQGGLVAFPSETVYGLGASALSSTAVRRVYDAKGRPSDNPLIVHAANAQGLAPACAPGALDHPTILKLTTRFWPGPLTLLVDRGEALAKEASGAGSRVAVRVPACLITRQLIECAGVPIVGPSANLSGRPSPTCVEHVLQDLDGRIEGVVDGGACDVGVESTVLDPFSSPPLILRPGAVTLDQLREVLPNVELFDPERHGAHHGDEPATPGLKYRHYAPRAPVQLVPAGTGLQDIVDTALSAHTGLIGVLTAASAFTSTNERLVVIPLGASPEAVAKTLYGGLRSMDDANVQAIILESVSEVGTGCAVMNRMRKCASGV